MSDFETGSVTANGVDFHYKTCGSGPLALCLHGFPDSPYTYRYLMPALADAGFRAVGPFMRGYAPTGTAPDGDYNTWQLGADANALHAALGGDGDAVLIAHDWGSVAAFGADFNFVQIIASLVVLDHQEIGGATVAEIHVILDGLAHQQPIATRRVSPPPERPAEVAGLGDQLAGLACHDPAVVTDDQAAGQHQGGKEPPASPPL